MEQALSPRSPLKPFTDSAWDNQPVKYGFFTRQGGVSTGLYDSLNLGAGSQDLPENVQENRRRIEHYFDDKPLITLHQIHSNQVITLDEQTPQTKTKSRCHCDQSAGYCTGRVKRRLFAGFVYGSERSKSQSQKRRTTDWCGACRLARCTGGVIQATVKALVDLGAAKNQINADRASDFATKL